MTEHEYTLDLSGPTLEAFHELIREHCQHLLNEFFGDFQEGKEELSEKDKTMAILALVAANSIHVAMHKLIADLTSMPEMIADYVVSSSHSTGMEIAKQLQKEDIVSSLTNSLEHLITVPGGDA